MALWHIPGQGIVDDSEEGANIPEPGSFTLPDGSQITWGIEGTQKLPEFRNTWQYGHDPFQWDPQHYGAGQGPSGSYAVGYIPQLIGWSEAAEAGTLKPYEREQYDAMVQAARAIPHRDISQLQAGYPGEGGDLSRYLTPASPDAGAVMLTLRDKIMGGQASEQERGLYTQFLRQMQEQDYRASVPQASDAFSLLGNDLFGPLATIAIGATGGLAAAPLFAGGAGLATTLGSVGTLAGIAGTGAGVLGQALDQPWLRNVGLGLGIAGGLAGGIGGLTNVLGSGINSVADAARLAQSAGRVTGALGRIPGASPLQQASRYLGLAGQLGQGVSGVQGLLGAAQGATEGATQAATQALSAPDLVTQRGGNMSEWDWLNLNLGSGEGVGTVLDSGIYAGGSPTFDESGGGWWDMGGAGVLAPQAGAPSWADYYRWAPEGGWNAGGAGSGVFSPEWQQSGQDLSWAQSHPGANVAGSGGGGLLNTILGGLGSVGGFLGRNAGVLGPAVSGLMGLGSGALGSNAAGDAARLQANALNRGLDLQTAQWLQQQANQAPWLEAGRTALGHMAGRSTWDQPTLQQPALLGTQPFQYSGPGMPGAGFQYTGAGMPQTGFQYTGPGMPDTGFQYANQFPMQDFTAPTWDELKARDPGIAARLTEAQQGLEASAAARGGALSGPAMAALQRQSQTLASQEYDPAYRRALGEYQQEYGQDWQRQQEDYGRALAQNQQLYGRQYQQQGDIYGRQLAENQLGYNRQWQQQDTDYQRQLAQNQLLYGRGMEQYKQGYGEQAALNQQDYARNQALYQQQMQQMTDAYNAARLNQNTAWNQFSSLAGTGQTALGQLGTGGQNAANSMGNLLTQLGQAQGQGALSSGNSWLNALQNLGTSAQGAFGNVAFQNQLRSLLSGANA
jgi:hypothetical protein